MTNSPLIPTMQYRDPTKAVEWLCEAFGFEPKNVFKDEEDKVTHAELQLGNSMIMISPRTETPFGRMVKTPLELANFNTHAIYVVVEDIDAHYQNAIEKGANISLELVEQAYGGKDYTCRDVEGFLWSFGTYDPWKQTT